MSKRSGQSIDIKIDPTGKSYEEALVVLREANDDLAELSSS
jgi:hypothetical protein